MVVIKTLLLLIVYQVQCADILALLPHVGKSHHLAFQPLLKKLAKHGHQVSVVSFFPLTEPVANYTDVSLQSLATIRKEAINLKVFETQNNVIDTFGLRQIKAFQPLSKLALEICSKLVNYEPLSQVLMKKYDVVLLENFNSDCLLGLLHVYKIKAPVIALSSCAMMHWSANRIGVADNPSFVPTITSEFTSRMSFLQRMENAAMFSFFNWWYRYAIQVKEKAIIEEYFKKRIPDLDVLARNVTMMLTNTFHSMNGVRSLLPGVVEVGGVHLQRHLEPIPQKERRPAAAVHLRAGTDDNHLLCVQSGVKY